MQPELSANTGKMESGSFIPLWYLRNAHLQTIMAKYLAPVYPYNTHAEQFILADGDYLQLNWTEIPLPGDQRPLVLLLHGLGGSLSSHYIQGMLLACRQHNWPAVVLHFRGCHGTPNNLPRAYHSGDTADLAAVAQQLQQRHPLMPIIAVGFSLGGNVLVKYCGEQGSDLPLHAAVAVSAPLMLAACSEKISKGFSRVYQHYLLNQLKLATAAKLCRFQPFPVPLTPQQLESIKTLEQFDQHYTAPVHGFESAQDYYQRASGKAFLRRITIPALVIHAKDDPFLSTDVIPSANELSPTVQYVLTEHGGHVGFISGHGLKPHFWLSQRICQFIQEQTAS